MSLCASVPVDEAGPTLEIGSSQRIPQAKSDFAELQAFVTPPPRILNDIPLESAYFAEQGGLSFGSTYTKKIAYIGTYHTLRRVPGHQ
ncbi:hypothetical protein PROFUN_12233 [Planoprotostelium fungivorum]|uniref:Uncharacterized protein n=1 Tax=Planoprotostelium fungivorum TaxID=1890364 RepID=A0A2P6N878_9EUKA|nr:hypothetical protein PROFUN_12233 [Planoprotostelium fungivorum]